MFLNAENSIPVFWRARCKMTGREMKFRTRMDGLPSADEMAKWVGEFFRHLDYIDHCLWDETEHAGRVAFPVPVQHVRFNVKVPDLRTPDRTRTSAYVTRSPIIRKPIQRPTAIRRASIIPAK